MRTMPIPLVSGDHLAVGVEVFLRNPLDGGQRRGAAYKQRVGRLGLGVDRQGDVGIGPQRHDLRRVLDGRHDEPFIREVECD